MRLRLVILDRDDTLIRVPTDRRYLYGNDEINFVDGVVEFLHAMHAAGVTVVLATNQQGVALPEYPEMSMETVDQFHRRLLDELDRRRANVKRVYVCPHAAAENCACRKPRPGLFLRAMAESGVAPEETAAIGDRWSDVQAAHASGVRALYLVGQAPVSAEAPPARAEVRLISSFAECSGQLLA